MLNIFVSETYHLAMFDRDTFAAQAADAPVVWYDLSSPTTDEYRLIEATLGISLPTREEMQEIEPSARLYNEAGAEFMTLTSLSNLETDEPVKTPITFILKDNCLVTLRYADLRPFSAFITRVQKPNGHPYTTGELIMLTLLESMSDRLADVLERAGDEIDANSREIFRSKTTHSAQKTQNLNELIERIGRNGDVVTLVRESLVSVSRLTSYFQTLESEGRKHSRDIKVRLRTIQRDATSLSDHAAFLSGKINFMLDATLGLINLQQNQIIKIFSVASVVFLPPTLVASVYGMNFDHMPELKWAAGYPWSIGLMILSAALPFLYFKRRGWL